MVVAISNAAKHYRMLMKCMKGVFPQPTTSILFAPTIPTIISFRAFRSGYATKRIYVSAKWPSKSNYKLVPMKTKTRPNVQSVALCSSCPKLISYEDYVAEEEARESIKAKGNPPTIQDLENESYKKFLAKESNKTQGELPTFNFSESHKKVYSKEPSQSLAQHKHDFQKQFIDSVDQEGPKIQYSIEKPAEFDSTQKGATQNEPDELVPKYSQPEISVNNPNTMQAMESNFATYGCSDTCYYACNTGNNGYSPCGHNGPCNCGYCRRLYSCGYNPYAYGFSGIAIGCNSSLLGCCYPGNQTGQPFCGKPTGCSCGQPGCGYCAMKKTPGGYYGMPSRCRCGQPGCRNCRMLCGRVSNVKPSDCEKPSGCSCSEPACCYNGMKCGGYYRTPSSCKCGKPGCPHCGKTSGRGSSEKPSGAEPMADACNSPTYNSLSGCYQVPRTGPGSTAYIDPSVFNDCYCGTPCRRDSELCSHKYVYDCYPSDSCRNNYSGCRCGARNSCNGCTPCAHGCGCGGQSWGPSNVKTMNPCCTNEWSSRVFLPGVKMSDD